MSKIRNFLIKGTNCFLIFHIVLRPWLFKGSRRKNNEEQQIIVGETIECGSIFRSNCISTKLWWFRYARYHAHKCIYRSWWRRKCTWWGDWTNPITDPIIAVFAIISIFTVIGPMCIMWSRARTFAFTLFWILCMSDMLGYIEKQSH